MKIKAQAQHKAILFKPKIDDHIVRTSRNIVMIEATIWGKITSYAEEKTIHPVIF